MSKKNKIPAVFKKPIPLNKWEKKYIGKIYLSEDRAFLEKEFIKKDDAMVLKREDFDKKEIKKLKSLGSIIKANRKGFRFSLLFVLVFIIALSVIWQFFLKNRVITEVMENQLENVFQSRVDIRGLNLSILKGDIRISNLEIADKERPMYNLVEIDNITADLDTDQLSLGNLHINELGLENFQRGGERKTSGALPSQVKPESSSNNENSSDSEKSGSEDSTGNDQVSGNEVNSAGAEESGSSIKEKISASVGQIDPQEILKNEMDNLKTPPLIETTEEKLVEYETYLNDQTEIWEGKLGQWDDDVKFIKSLNSKSFKNMAAAQSSLNRLTKIYNQAEKDIKDINTVTKTAKEQWNESEKLYNNLRSAIEQDKQYLMDFVNMSGGERMQWAAGILDQQMEEPVMKYVNYLLQGKTWMERFIQSGGKKEAKEAKRSYQARSLPLGPDAPPRFVLHHGYFSLEQNGLQYSVDVSDITTNPSRWEEKPEIDLKWDSNQTGPAEISATMEQAKIMFEDLRFDMGDIFTDLGIEKLAGEFSIDSDVQYGDEGITGQIDMNIRKFNIEEAENQNRLSEILTSTLSEASDINCSGTVNQDENGRFTIQMRSELDSLMNDALGKLLEEASKESAEQLESYWNEYTSGSMKEISLLTDNINGSMDELQGMNSSLESYKKMADDKQKEIKKSVQNSAQDSVEDAIRSFF